MKNLLLIFSVLLSTSLFAVEYGYLNYDNRYIILEEGDTFTPIGGWISYLYVFTTSLLTEDNALPVDFNTDIADERLLTSSGTDGMGVIVGPAVVVMEKYGIGSRRNYCPYLLQRQNEYQNTNIYSIFGNANASHNIVVETSTDLENWTPVHSSGITGSSEQIYVRTRISTSE